MSVFTDSELDYLAGQRLGRIATVGPDGQPHVVPTSFRYNPDHDAIEVGGLRMSQTKKLRDARRTGRCHRSGGTEHRSGCQCRRLDAGRHRHTAGWQEGLLQGRAR